MNVNPAAEKQGAEKKQEVLSLSNPVEKSGRLPSIKFGLLAPTLEMEGIKIVRKKKIDSPP